MPVEVVVPPLGATVDTLTLVAWYKREGDRVEKGEPLFAVETDKATLDVESPAAGILSRVSAEPGDDVVSLSRIALIVTPGEPDDVTTIRIAERVVAIQGSEASDEPDQRGTLVALVVATQGSEARDAATSRDVRAAPGDRIFISPRAKRLAEEKNFDWRQLHGTGPGGAIVERDVLLF